MYTQSFFWLFVWGVCSGAHTLGHIWWHITELKNNSSILSGSKYSTYTGTLVRKCFWLTDWQISIKGGGHFGSVTGVSGQGGGISCPSHHKHVKISWHLLVSSHSVRWRSSGNYTHLHVLIWLISRNKHFPMTQATRWATHLQKLW